MIQDKFSIQKLKDTIRQLTSRLKEFANALEVDKRIADSSSLLRRSLLHGGGRPTSSKGSSPAASTAAMVEDVIHDASQLGEQDQEIALLDFLFTGL